MKVREPNGPIQVTPAGLLGLLSLKTGGLMPDAMRQDVQPTVPLDAYWLRAKRVFDQVNRGITLAAASYDNFQNYSPNTITVPETEWWYVHSYSVRGNVSGAGASINSLRLAMLWNPVGTQRFRFLGDGGNRENFMTDARPYSLMLAESFWCPPGSQLGFFVGSVSGAGLDMTVVGLDYTALPV